MDNSRFSSSDSSQPDQELSRENTALFQMFVDSVQDYAIFALDPLGYIATWNTGAARLKGYSADEIIGKHFSIFYSAEEAERGKPQRGLEVALRDGKFEEEGWRVKKDGSPMWASVLISPIRSESGILRGYAKVTRDITSQMLMAEMEKARNELLAESQRALAEAQEVAKLGSTILELSTGKTIWSTQMYSLLGRPDTAGETGLEDTIQLFDAEDATRLKAAIELAIAEGVPYALDVRFHAFPEDPPRWLHTRGRVVADDTGKPARLVTTSMDITERKTLEEKLKLSEESLRAKSIELERSNADLEQFAYVASHDLQEPLRAVAGYLGLLREDYQGKLSEEADRWIGKAVAAAHRMHKLITDLLNYSQVGRPGPGSKACNLNEALETALANLQVAISENGAEVTYEPLPQVEGDMTRLVSLLQNLIGNAIKYRREEPPRIHVSAVANGPDWLFEVVDNGRGIEPQFLEEIFEPFQRFESEAALRGSGIGLAVCKKVVELHGGQIWVESEPGRGSTFRFTLPMQNSRG